MHTGQTHYPYNAPRPTGPPQHNVNGFHASPAANSLFERMSEHTGTNPPRAPSQNHSPSLHGPRAPEAQVILLSPATNQRVEQAQSDSARPSLPSEETVDAFLESVLKTEVAASLHPPAASSTSPPTLPPTPTASSQAKEPTPPSAPGRQWDPALLSTTRALLLPPLLANARARDPGAQWDEAAAAALLTDEWCAEMIVLARRAREEMRKRVAEPAAARGLASAEGAASVLDAGEDGVRSVMDTREDGAWSANAPGPSCVRDDPGVEYAGMDLEEQQPESQEMHPAEDVSMGVVEDRTEPPEPPMPQGTVVQGHGAPHAQPMETMLGTAAHVLQDFLSKTPRPRNEVLPVMPEADAGAPPADESAHTAGPSSARSSQTLEEAPPQEVLHTPTPQTPGSGLWAVQVGSNVPKITTVAFDVHETVAAAVQRWARRHSAFE